MLKAFLLFTSSTLFLYLSSQTLINRLLNLFSRLTKSSNTAVNLIFFLFLPGIFLHELSHIISAVVLGVPTGRLSLKPTIKIKGSEPKQLSIQLGSAQIAHTDPIRLTLIGTAPFTIGTIILWLILTVGLKLNLNSLSITPLTQTPFYLLILFFYLCFTVSNIMFSSKSDLKSAAFPLILILIILGTIKLLNLSTPQIIITHSVNLLTLLSTIFFLTLALNLIIITPLKLLDHYCRHLSYQSSPVIYSKSLTL